MALRVDLGDASGGRVVVDDIAFDRTALRIDLGDASCGHVVVVVERVRSHGVARRSR
jgi:hypothetical protein